ncbi:K(+)/H(+) antiporter [Blastocladiella emersonii ATCC 22665]|nr:K(+)/H(+) antiporter [Blastocladiella emersonii ATCC 22665]
MVIMAVTTTMMTSPIVSYLDPAATALTITGAVANPSGKRAMSPTATTDGRDDDDKFQVLITLDRFERVPALMTLVQSLRTSPGTPDTSSAVAPSTQGALSLVAVRLMELSERTSEVMRLAESAETLRRDPLVNVLVTFAALNRVAARSVLGICPAGEFGERVAAEAHSAAVDLIVLPYSGSRLSGQFVAAVQRAASVTVGALLDQGLAGTSDGATVKFAASVTARRPTLLFVFLGGEDDRDAVDVVLRMAASGQFDVAVFRVRYGDEEARLEYGPLAKSKKRNSIIGSIAGGVGARSRKKSGNGSTPRPADLLAAGSGSDVNLAASADHDAAASPAASPAVAGIAGETPPLSLDLPLTRTRSYSMSAATPDDAAFARLRDQLAVVAASVSSGSIRVTVDEYEHPEPHEFALRRVLNLAASDLVVTGKRHGLMNVLALASQLGTSTAATAPAASKLKDSEVELLPHPGSLAASAAENAAANQLTTRSLFSSLIGTARGNGLVREPSAWDVHAAPIAPGNGGNAGKSGPGTPFATVNLAAPTTTSDSEPRAVFGTFGTFLVQRGARASILTLQGTGSLDEVVGGSH